MLRPLIVSSLVLLVACGEKSESRTKAANVDASKEDTTESTKEETVDNSVFEQMLESKNGGNSLVDKNSDFSDFVCTVTITEDGKKFVTKYDEDGLNKAFDQDYKRRPSWTHNSKSGEITTRGASLVCGGFLNRMYYGIVMGQLRGDASTVAYTVTAHLSETDKKTGKEITAYSYSKIYSYGAKK